MNKNNSLIENTQRLQNNFYFSLDQICQAILFNLYLEHNPKWGDEKKKKASVMF